MKKIKGLLFILLILTLAISLFACKKDCEHIDEDGDGKCDKCNEEIELEQAQVLLFDQGIPTFRFVLGGDVSKDAKKLISEYISALDEIGLDVEQALDIEDDGEYECEILIGNVQSRGKDYIYDNHTLGKDGYAFKIIGKKILVTAGSDDALCDAIEIFISDILKFDEDSVNTDTLYMTSSQEVLEIQDNYKVTALKVNGNDIKDYTIATHMTQNLYYSAATAFQDMLYSRTGYWLEIVNINQATAKSIIIKSIDKVYDENSFKIYTNTDGQLIIDCAFVNKLENELASFVTAKITSPDISGEVNFNGDVYKQDISFVTYEEFGAKGDGKTNDFPAIDAAHREANQYGQTVKAKDSATYYIGDSARTVNNNVTAEAIPIKTNVIWGNAKFIIDDRQLEVKNAELTSLSPAKYNVFAVQSDYDPITISDKETLNKVIASGLGQGTEKLPLTFDYPVMIIPYDSTHTVYRRIGYGAAQGSTMHEIILLDKDGNVDPETPVMFDYQVLDKITVYRLDIEPITIEGGTFTTRANRVNVLVKNGYNGTYIQRGITISRSFTTLKNVKHYVTDEVTVAEQISNGTVVHASSPYSGFFAAKLATNVTLDGCVLTGRRCYIVPGYGTEGTYDLNGSDTNKLVFKNCTQSNFWIEVDPDTHAIKAAESRDVSGAQTSMLWVTHDGINLKLHWGIGGTNFCKNLEYIDSVLSRFDAHQGLYNGKIIGCTINYMALTGNGNFIVEDTDWYSEGTGSNSASIFHLRSDYGSTWNGSITAKNLNAYIYSDSDAYLFLHSYANWYFGYVAAMPNLSLDNLNIYDIKTYEPVEAGHNVYMIQNSVANEPRLHLEYTQKSLGKYCYIDLDKDGLVDGTSIPYVDADKSNHGSGINLPAEEPERLKNLNVIAPPEYLKIINNDGVDKDGDGTPDGGYRFLVYNTAGKGIPAADDLTGLDPDVDPQGGFFATTKFWYSETEYCRVGEANNGTFAFY